MAPISLPTPTAEVVSSERTASALITTTVARNFLLSLIRSYLDRLGSHHCYPVTTGTTIGNCLSLLMSSSPRAIETNIARLTPLVFCARKALLVGRHSTSHITYYSIPTFVCQEHLDGFEPTLRAWKACVLTANTIGAWFPCTAGAEAYARTGKWTARDSNPAPPACKAGALPDELAALVSASLADIIIFRDQYKHITARTGSRMPLYVQPHTFRYRFLLHTTTFMLHAFQHGVPRTITDVLSTHWKAHLVAATVPTVGTELL